MLLTTFYYLIEYMCNEAYVKTLMSSVTCCSVEKHAMKKFRPKNKILCIKTYSSCKLLNLSNGRARHSSHQPRPTDIWTASRTDKLTV